MTEKNPALERRLWALASQHPELTDDPIAESMAAGLVDAAKALAEARKALQMVEDWWQEGCKVFQQAPWAILNARAVLTGLSKTD